MKDVTVSKRNEIKIKLNAYCSLFFFHGKEDEFVFYRYHEGIDALLRLDANAQFSD